MEQENRRTVHTYEEAVRYTESGTDIIVETIVNQNGESVPVQDLISGIPQLIVLGCGHVGGCTAELGARLGYHVVMADPREEYAQRTVHPYADQVYCLPYEEVWKMVPDTEETYVVLSVGDPDQCFRSIRDALQHCCVYVGMLGSRAKVRKVRERLLREGCTEECLETRLHAPIGIPLGGERPMEVALSIMAEVTRCRHNRKHTPLEPDIQQYLKLKEQGKKLCILALILEVKGVAPRSAGSRMLVFEDGSIKGTIGGGDTEYQTMQYAAEMLRTGEETAIIQCTHGDHAKIRVMLRRLG